jgi:hypothetical protein
MLSPLLITAVVFVQLQFHWGLSVATAAFLPTLIVLELNYILLAPATRKEVPYKRGALVQRARTHQPKCTGAAANNKDGDVEAKTKAGTAGASGDAGGAGGAGASGDADDADAAGASVDAGDAGDTDDAEMLDEEEAGDIGEVVKPLKLRIQPEEEQLLVQLRAMVHEGRAKDEGISDQEWGVIFTCDQTMVKYLRARHNDLEKATQMCLESLRWRTSLTCDGIVGVSNLVGEGGVSTEGGGSNWIPPASFDRYVIRCTLPRDRTDLPFAPLFFAEDLQNHLVSHARVGLLDLAGVYQELGEERMLGCFVFCLEHTRRALLQHHSATGVRPMLTAVVDLTGE